MRRVSKKRFCGFYIVVGSTMLIEAAVQTFTILGHVYVAVLDRILKSSRWSSSSSSLAVIASCKKAVCI